MMTLAEAVAELEAMEDPMEILRKYPNKYPSTNTASPFSICENCPVAGFIKEKTGKPAWVSPDEARPSWRLTEEAIPFSNKLKAVIAELDLDRWNARHAT